MKKKVIYILLFIVVVSTLSSQPLRVDSIQANSELKTKQDSLYFIATSIASGIKNPPKKLLIDTTQVALIKINGTTEKDVFSDPAYKYKEDDKQHGRNFIQEFLDWLFKDWKDKKEKKDDDYKGWWNIEWVGNLLMWLFIAVVLGLIIWLLSKAKWGGVFSKAPLETPFDFKELTEDIEGLNIDKLIEEARKNNNFRLATRWWYIKLLRKFAVCDLIEWAPHKTNIEYFVELQSTPYLDQFKQASFIYENVWYGEAEITEAHYARFIPGFIDLEKNIRA